MAVADRSVYPLVLTASMLGGSTLALVPGLRRSRGRPEMAGRRDRIVHANEAVN